MRICVLTFDRLDIILTPDSPDHSEWLTSNSLRKCCDYKDNFVENHCASGSSSVNIEFDVQQMFPTFTQP